MKLDPIGVLGVLLMLASCALVLWAVVAFVRWAL